MPPTFLLLWAYETPEFFVLFTSPGYAIQLPKRALATAGDVTRVRNVLRRTLGDQAEVESTVSTVVATGQRLVAGRQARVPWTS